MKKLIQSFGINETFTSKHSIKKEFNQVKNSIRHEPNYNMMADLLMLPETKKKFRYLYIMVDLYTDAFDCVPMKNKTSLDTLTALKTILKRKTYLSEPKTLQTDSGSEFRGEFHQYRKERRGSIKLKDNPYTSDIGPVVLPKYKIGDLVHERLDRPENALGHRQNTEKFREGDYRYSKVPKKIVKIIVMNDKPFYRYMLKGIDNASYAENELFMSKLKEEVHIVKALIGHRGSKKNREYLVWWKGYDKKEATYEPKAQLIEDGLQRMIDDYEAAL